MATTLQFRRGNSAAAAAVTGADGEIYINTQTKSIHIHDGSTAGGFALANTTSAANASNLTTGIVPTARLGTGTANSTTILYGNNVWAALPSANLSAVAQDVLPSFNDVYDIGSASKRWNDLFVSSTVNINGATLTGSLTGAGYLITTNNNFAANTITVNSALLGNVSVVGTTVSAIDSYGAPQTLTVDGNLTVSGVINAGIESVATYTLGSSNTASINAVSSPIAYAQSLTSNITADFAIPTALSTNGRVATYVVVVAQGSTPYIINAVKVNTVTQTISWQGGSAPTGNANKKDVFSFTLMRLSGSWVVLGSMNTYG